MTSTYLSRAGSALGGLNNRIVLALGLTQTIGYGTLYYAYGVLVPAVGRTFEVELNWLFGIFSIGILLGGLFAPLIGRELDRRGARVILTGGSALAGLALCLCAASQNIYLFCAGVVFIEIAAGFVLYEAAFGGLTQIYRHDARRHITSVTLIAGFASTIFWPLTQELVTRFDWRWTMVLFAMAHIIVCLPLHYFILRAAVPVEAKHEASDTTRANEPVVHQGAERQRAFMLYAIAICASGIVYSAFPIHMLTIISNEGFTATHAAMIAMFMGPAQVLARLVEVSFGQRFDAMVTGKVSLGCLVACICLLLATPGSLLTAIAFAMLYGVSQGLITIARGTVPLQLFGIRGYGALVGKVSGIRFFVNASAPFLFAFFSTKVGIDFALMLCGAAAMTSVAAFWMLKRPKLAVE